MQNGLCARQRGLQLLHRGSLSGPKVEDEQAFNVSNEALYVIGLHGSGDKISRFLQDWEVAKVSPELPYSIGHAVPRIIRSGKEDVIGLVFEQACRLSDKAL